jgi:hypothetical protein
MNEGELDLAAAAAGATPRRDEIERKRRVAFFVAECDRELGFPEGDRLVDHVRNGSFDDWIDRVLRAALASGGKLDPRRYRAIWMLKNAMNRTAHDG